MALTSASPLKCTPLQPFNLPDEQSEVPQKHGRIDTEREIFHGQRLNVQTNPIKKPPLPLKKAAFWPHPIHQITSGSLLFCPFWLDYFLADVSHWCCRMLLKRRLSLHGSLSTNGERPGSASRNGGCPALYHLWNRHSK